MREATNLMKLDQDPLVDLVHDAVDESELTVGNQMYESYHPEPTYQKLKRKPKLQKIRRKR